MAGTARPRRQAPGSGRGGCAGSMRRVLRPATSSKRPAPGVRRLRSRAFGHHRRRTSQLRRRICPARDSCLGPVSIIEGDEIREGLRIEGVLRESEGVVTRVLPRAMRRRSRIPDCSRPVSSRIVSGSGPAPRCFSLVPTRWRRLCGCRSQAVSCDGFLRFYG